MFSHFLAGELVFLILGVYFGFDINAKFLIFGAFCGFLPDILSYIIGRRLVKNNKWYHKHRDNFSHSVFLPVIIFLLLFFWVDIRLSFLIALAVSTHFMLDLWGIGWGVKLFLPFSGSIYKLFYRGEIIHRFKNDKDREREVKKHGKDDWFQVAYFFSKPSRWLKWWGVFEWISLLLAILLVIYVMF